MTNTLGDRNFSHQRRSFIRSCTAILVLGSGMLPFGAAQAASSRELRLLNTHTGEHLQQCYFRDGAFAHDACQRLNHFLRDHRTGDVSAIDPKLFDLLYSVQHEVGHRGVIEIISGYRSQATNAKLNAASSGVAKRSLHMQGKALDIRLSGFDSARLRDAALSLRAGGVGYYAKSDFVHVDTGRVRHW
jgi:uncharacterized protein YcbK (DUF882 family)